MEIRRQIGVNVKRERDRLGWSQEELADQSGLHRTYVSGVERGVRNPTVEIIAKLGKALGVAPFELLKPTSGRKSSGGA